MKDKNKEAPIVKKVIKKKSNFYLIKKSKDILIKNLEDNDKQKLLVKSHKNPILSPKKEEYWENLAVFNPAAILLDEKIHLLYRAMGDADISVLGHIESSDGEHFDIENRFKFYEHRNFEDKKSRFKIHYSSGGIYLTGNNGGCEDPRLVEIENTIYLTYTAFNGWDSVRMCLSTISKNDFLQKKDNWAKPVYLSPPMQIHKNWVLFPEKINGKFAFLHAITPKIMIDYLDNISDIENENYIFSIHQKSPLWQYRDKHVRGAGPPPIKTDIGWLVLYHGMEKQELNKYKLFAMILDLKDPTKILYNYKNPILEPEEFYENTGIKPNIVYSCGAVVKNQELYVYYGASDNYICLAKSKLDEILKIIKSKSLPIIISQKELKSK